MKNLFRLFAVIESKFSIKFRFQHCSEQLRNPPSGIFNAQVRAQWSKKKHQSRSLNSTRMCLYAVATCRAAALCEADEWWSSSAGQQATWCFIRHEWDWFQVVIKLSRHKCRVPPPELVVNRKEKFTFNLLTKLKFSCRCGFTALCHPLLLINWWWWWSFASRHHRFKSTVLIFASSFLPRAKKRWIGILLLCK